MTATQLVVPGRGSDERLSMRRAFGDFPTGVTVVTVGGERPHGMTANSFTSVSLDPPMVLVCIARTATMHDRILAVDHFAVSVLGSEHATVARYFADASRPSGQAQFDPGAWVLGTGDDAPYLQHAEAVFLCRRGAVHDAGDHIVVLGEVRGVRRSGGQAPLLFAHGRLSAWSVR